MSTARKQPSADPEDPGEATGGQGPPMALVRRRIAEANDAYVRANSPVEMSPAPRLRLAVVACMDCRLTGRLDAALGLGPGDAIVLRVAGNTAAGSDDVTRSLAVAAIELGVRNVLVVGHTHCGMKGIDPILFEERLSARGGSRFALGFLTLREWLGVFRDEEQNVRDTVERIRRSPILPCDLRVEGALFDIETGELTWLDAL